MVTIATVSALIALFLSTIPIVWTVATGVIVIVGLFVAIWCRAPVSRGQLAFGTFIFITSASFRKRALTESSLDWQVGLRIMFALIAMTVAVRYARHLRTTLSGGAALPIVVVVAAAWISAVFSTAPLQAAGAALLLTSYVATTALAFAALGRARALATLMGVLALYIISSFPVALLVPTLGTHGFYRNGGSIVRLAGLAGHGNILGQYSVCLLVLLVGDAIVNRAKRSHIMGVLVSLVVLVATQSRISVVAGVLSVGFILVRRIRLFAAFAAAGLLVALLFTIMSGVTSDQALAPLARSGEAQEVVTLTGRTNIWGLAVSYGSESVIVGHGYGAARVGFMDRYESRWGWKPSHTHNMFLEAYVTMGLLGLLPLVWLVLRYFKKMAQAPSYADVAFLAICVIGVGEAGVMSNPPNPLLSLFLIAYWWRMSPNFDHCGDRSIVAYA